MPGMYWGNISYNYKINHSFYYNTVIIDDNIHIDQQNFYLIGNRLYTKQDLHASHFQVLTVLPDFL